MEQYNIDFSEAEDLSILPNQSLVSRPPAMVTTSPKGDMVVLLEIQKDLDDYSEKQFLIVLYPYIANAKMMDDSTLQLLDGTYTTFWEIDGVEHVTHLAMDKLGIIYFTTGESLYRINKAEGDMYLDTFEDIFTPSNDTSHITCLWRQNNDLYLTIQDWDSEENLDLYKVIPPKDKGVATPSTPEDNTPGVHRAKSPSFGSRGHSPRHSKRRSRSRSGSTGYGSDYASSPRGRGTANDSNLFVNKVRTFSLSYNSRIWQLGTMRFEKKMLLAVGAAQLGSAPQILQIGFKKKINALPIMGTGKSYKSVMWPRSVPDQVPHSVEFHKATKTWFCILPVTKGKSGDGALYWMQFRMDKTKKKIIWQRLIPIPEEAKEGDWLYYDELRDVLIGFARGDDNEKQYIFKFLPGLSKHLWIEFEDDDDQKEDDSKANSKTNSKANSKATSKPKRSNSKGPPKRSGSKGPSKGKGSNSKGSGKSTKSMGTPTPSTESLIKPSSARKKKGDGTKSKKKKKTKKEKVETEQTVQPKKESKKKKIKKVKPEDVAHRQNRSRGSVALNDLMEKRVKEQRVKDEEQKAEAVTDEVQESQGVDMDEEEDIMD